MSYSAKLDFDWAEGEADPAATIDKLFQEIQSSDPPALSAYAKSMRIEEDGSQVVVEYPPPKVEFTTSARLVFDKGGRTAEEVAQAVKDKVSGSGARTVDVEIIDLDFSKTEPGVFTVGLKLPS